MTPKAKGLYFGPKDLEKTTLSYNHFIKNAQAKPRQHFTTAIHHADPLPCQLKCLVIHSCHEQMNGWISDPSEDTSYVGKGNFISQVSIFIFIFSNFQLILFSLFEALFLFIISDFFEISLKGLFPSLYLIFLSHWVEQAKDSKGRNQKSVVMDFIFHVNID